MMSAEKILPVGQADFHALRESNAIYVDKTALIHQLAVAPRGVFLARPRRFGKSLLVSTLESLFKFGLRDFQGLAIESLWTDKVYDVVHLDFSRLKEFKNIEDFSNQFRRHICKRFSRVGFQPEGSSDDLADLDDWVGELPSLSLVLLIDEYDAPLTICLNNPELFEAVRSEMRRFFLSLKSNVGSLRFLFLTGITKFSSTSIFSELNNLVDITLTPTYGALLGYTEEEIRQNFGYYLSKAAKTLAMSEEELIDGLRSHYNGFCFDMRASKKLFCPWSVLNFLDAPDQGFQNYWFASGGHPTVLMKYLEGHELEDPANFAELKEAKLSDLNTPGDLTTIDRDILLTQTGYLTIKSVDDFGIVTLGYPNQEVIMSMAELYAKELLGGRLYRPADGVLLTKLLGEGEIAPVINRFNEAFNALNYDRHPVVNEAACTSYLQALMMGADMVPEVEVHTALGRSDLEVTVGEWHWVFEVKFAATTQKAEALLTKAISQIKSRRYGERPHGKKLIRVALVYSAEDRRFVVWKNADAEKS